MKGKVQTVLGDVDPSELGRVMPHEHFEVGIHDFFYKPPFVKGSLESSEISLKNLGWIRQFPYSHSLNMHVRGSDVKDAFLDELKQFKSYGGGTVVDNTIYGIKGVMDRMANARELSKETGVHIIVGTGYYVNASLSESILAMSEESIASTLTTDLTVGAKGDPTVKCGILGENGCSWPLTDFERRNLRACAAVESSCGCPVMIHPGRNRKAPEEIVRVFAEAGGNCKRLVMGHLDRTLHENEDILEFASLGTFLEYDLFGIETSYYQQHEEVAMPSDSQRIQRIQTLVQEGYEDRILISHDIHTRHRLEKYGGHGFSHILTIVVPMMLKKGIPQETIDKFLIKNPANWLTFAK